MKYPRTALFFALALAIATKTSVAQGHDCQNKENSKTAMPTIGILAPDNVDPEYKGTPFIPACYSKFLESGGARVIPFNPREPEDEFIEKLTYVNGFYFPGLLAYPIKEDGSLNDFEQRALLIYQYAKNLNERGEYFPLFGVCMGFAYMA